MTEPRDIRISHLRQIHLWPVYLLPLDEDAAIQEHSEHLAKPAPGNPWRELDDEFGEPGEFQERHYNEFVTFTPPVQRFLYGQGLGKAVRKSYGESPIRVMRRTDIAGVRVTLEAGAAPVTLQIAHVDLYFFFDIDVCVLAIETYAGDLPLEIVQDLMFRMGRAYPAYWEPAGRGGHCPWKVEWLSADGAVLATSDYEKREKFLSFVCEHRAPAVSAHWEYLLAPLVLHYGNAKGPLRFRQLEYYRMPAMTYIAMPDPAALTRADLVRLALGSEPGPCESLPYSKSYLADFEARYCYDRYRDDGGSDGGDGTRFMAAGHSLIAIGRSSDPFFTNAEGGILGRFRHQHFLLFLIAHFQKAALGMFSDRLVAAVSRLDIADERANRVFRRDIRFAHENFLRFNHRYWFHEISNQAQSRELFAMTRTHLKLDDLFAEVREELQDMGTFLDVEAMRRQNDTVVRLTVVTTFGLIGTVTTGFLGMNLIAWAEQTPQWRVLAFLAVLIPATLLTFYTVMKSRRLSEFLDVLSEERAGFGARWRAFWRVWWPRR